MLFVHPCPTDPRNTRINIKFAVCVGFFIDIRVYRDKYISKLKVKGQLQLLALPRYPVSYHTMKDMSGGSIAPCSHSPHVDTMMTVNK
jgi:hypothetical protein